MSATHKILSVLLVIMLTGSNMAISGHIPNHAPADFGSCAQCIHAGGFDDAIPPVGAVVFVTLTEQAPGLAYTSALFLPPGLQDHQSRAPPSVS